MSWFSRLLGGLMGNTPAGVAKPSPAPKPGVPVHVVGDPAPVRRLAALLRAAEFGDPEAWAARLVEPMRMRGIANTRREAAFIATIAHESNGGRQLEEALSYSADRARVVWPARFPTPESAAAVARNPEALAEAVYGGRMGNGPPGRGDGWAYRGRGLIQLTGKAAYGAAADALGTVLLREPDLAAEPRSAAHIAAWWWATHGCNELADTGDVEAWRRRVNGGLTGLYDVRRRYNAVLAAIGAEALSG